MGDWKTYQLVIAVLLALVLGGAIGFTIANYFFKKEGKKLQKQMESLDKEQLRNMSSVLGRKLSEEQINKAVKTVKELSKSKNKDKVAIKKKPKK